MMLTHCGNNVRNRYSGCVFPVKDIVPVPLKTSRNLAFMLWDAIGYETLIALLAFRCRSYFVILRYADDLEGVAEGGAHIFLRSGTATPGNLPPDWRVFVL